MLTAALAGLGLGLFVAAQVGPVSLLCVRTVLRYGLAPGLAIGMGAALVDVAYATLGMLGVAQLVQSDVIRWTLGTVGAGVLIWMGARTLWTAHRVRLGLETVDEVTTVGAALRTSVLATASNPLTIASWASIFAAASTAALTSSTASAVSLLVGLGVGSVGWFTVLAIGVALARRRIGDRLMRVVDAISGAGLVTFGGILAFRAARDT
ncbi:LysE family translocator [Cryptosporangium aurantiacum]|uniref:Threonine/homoserine/homoserine lactone efflux protein n=1 Tax=Cryptosporangium aurantiacum TaxID=134849 RepID=A0A1M7Q9Q3_9ACTN|nr:LysE family transporter [Cryptosporangium aurantiacum]SHN27436.1 Threonine/homoserine/homoserine lactone efflux protein [Cryptosporangium aurantiacum]